MNDVVISPELVLVTPELRATACAFLPPYPPYPARRFVTSSAHRHHRMTQVAAYTLSATARTTVWGVAVASSFATVALVAHFV